MSDTDKMSAARDAFIKTHTPDRLREAIDRFATMVAKMARESIEEQLAPAVGPLYAEDQIAQVLQNAPGLTRTELVSLTGLQPDDVTRACASLKATGRVYKIGGRRYARWYPMRGARHGQV